MESRFERNIGPISSQEQEILFGKKVVIAGCGGIGGYLIEFLSRVGIGHIVCIDKDAFDETNLNRQILATEETIGQKKAECAEKRVHSIWRNCKVLGIVADMNPETLPDLINGTDLVLDALDNGNTRIALAKACRDAKIPLAHAAASGWKVQASIIRPEKNLYELLYSKEQRQIDGVLPFTAAAAANLQAALVVQYLCRGASDAPDVLHVLDLLDMTMEKINY